MKPLSTPSVGCEHPLELLDACHERILRFADLTRKIARHVDEKGVDDEAMQAARSVIRYFDEAGARHHVDEEEDLFPALLRCAPADDHEAAQLLVNRLRRDHEELTALWASMRTRLQGLVEGAGTPLEAVVADAFMERYRRHIEIEDTELLPLARRLLDSATVDAIGASMAARRGVVPRAPS